MNYPKDLLKPIRDHLTDKLHSLVKRRKEIIETDPVHEKERLVGNADIGDEAMEEVGHMQAFALRATVDRSIIQIRKALTRIKIGTYGTCERCGKMIDTDRLMVMPETTLCVDCEKKREK